MLPEDSQWAEMHNVHVYKGLTSAGADHRVKSISVALWHTVALNGAGKGNHTQTIQWSIKNSWHEFTLQASGEGGASVRHLTIII